MINKTHYSLLSNLVLTELKLKYRSSVLGFLWALLEPLLIALTLLIVFTQLFTSNLANFPAYLLTGFVAWFFLADGTNTLKIIVGKKELFQKIKFPKELIILSQGVVTLIESLASFIILILILFFVLKTEFTIHFFMFPLIFILQFIFILGCLTILSSLYVFVRDLSKIWSILVQIWFFLTPIVYPQSLLSKKNYILLTLNPMLHFINAYRNILVYGNSLSFNAVLILCFFSLTTFMIGWRIFKRLDPKMVEEV